MKKASLVVAVSFSLMSASAFAGGNCIYGHAHEVAEVAAEPTNEEVVDPSLLALLKKQQEQSKQMSPVITFN